MTRHNRHFDHREEPEVIRVGRQRTADFGFAPDIIASASQVRLCHKRTNQGLAWLEAAAAFLFGTSNSLE